MSMKFDLDQQISQLEKRRTDLQNYSLDTSPTAPPLTDQQIKVTAWLTSIDQKLIYLKNIRANRTASQVVVNSPTPQETTDLNNALTALSRPIQQNEAFSNLLGLVTALLNAVGTIGKFS